MKTLFASGISLLVGLTIGWFIGHRAYDRYVTNEAVRLMLDSSESSDREHAARAARAVEMIQSGRSSDAIELLSRPIADYYYFHVSLTRNDERTKEMLAMIERLAGTNKVMADAIHSKIQ